MIVASLLGTSETRGELVGMFDLQSIERASGCFLRNERFQVLA
jgi:hypothetical protein